MISILALNKNSSLNVNILETTAHGGLHDSLLLSAEMTVNIIDLAQFCSMLLPFVTAPSFHCGVDSPTYSNISAAL